MMKPIVIESDENGIAKITVKSLQVLLEDAYNTGFEDGKKDATPMWYQPHSIPTVGQPNWYDDKFKYGKYDVTCNNSNGDLSFRSMAKQRGD